MKMHPTGSFIASSLFLVTLAACGEDGPQPPPSDATPVTFSQHVAPIVERRCLSCHRAGGIGPFRLDTYDQVRARAGLMAAAVQARTMPPWLAKGDGTCGDFQDSAWLSEAEIETITRWARTGAAEGPAAAALQPPAAASLAQGAEVANPRYRPQPTGGQFAHADDYRCFAVDAALPGPQFLTGYEVLPGNPALIHHVLLLQVDPAKVLEDGRTNGDVMRALHGASPQQEGWPCYGLAGEGVEVAGIPVTWAPGMGAVRFPEGTGVRMSPQIQLVMQVHYNLARPELVGQPDVTRIRLQVADSVERPGFFDDQDEFLRTIASGTPASLAPGQKHAEYSWEMGYDRTLAAAGAPYLDVYGIFPHMHGTGRTQRVEIVKPDGTRTCAVDVPAWDFDWQLYYLYKQPLRLEPGDKVRVTCGYDTSGRKDPVLPGWGTDNEMCFLGLFLVPPKR
jgi:predicted small lipoprotein YifL